jgi:hypothetical protein
MDKDRNAILWKLMQGAKWGTVAGDIPLYSSPRLSSSGRTSSIQRKGGRKARKEHYTRKAVLERKKEEKRRQLWALRNPGASEENWRRGENLRKTRKAIERSMRKKIKSQ